MFLKVKRKMQHYVRLLKTRFNVKSYRHKFHGISSRIFHGIRSRIFKEIN